MYPAHPTRFLELKVGRCVTGNLWIGRCGDFVSKLKKPGFQIEQALVALSMNACRVSMSRGLKCTSPPAGRCRSCAFAMPTAHADVSNCGFQVKPLVQFFIDLPCRQSRSGKQQFSDTDGQCVFLLSCWKYLELFVLLSIRKDV